jgi:hypothetical protein
MRRAIVAAIAVAGCGENLTPAAGLDATPPLACTPNLDGMIEAREFVELASVRSLALRSPPGSSPVVDVRGVVDDRGRHTWSLAGDALGTVPHEVSALAIASRWYADHFPAARFAFTSADGALDSLYSQTADALWLHGLASTDEQPARGQTLIVYADPVLVYRFPFTRGDTWTTTTEVPAGTFDGISFSGRDTYVITNDASGFLELPDLSFTQAHRVRFAITSQPAIGPAITRRQVAFLFECFGEVARITSRVDEPAEDFTIADEVTRFSVTH